MIETIRLQRDSAVAWAWMPLALDRIQRFCVEFDTDSLPWEMVEMVRVWFSMGDPRLGLWIAVREGQHLVGHILAHPEPAGASQWRYCLIRQAWVDPGVDLRREATGVFQAVDAWARSLGLGELLIVTHRNQAAMARRWGFSADKVLMRRRVEKEPWADPMAGPQ